MAKAVALTPGIMSTPKTSTTSRNKASATTAPKGEPSVPLQIRIPASEAKAIKRAALEADQTISEFMLECFHAHMKA